MEPAALSLFLQEVEAGRDEALTQEFAIMMLGKSRSVFYRMLKSGGIPPLVSVGRFTRFSRESLKLIVI